MVDVLAGVFVQPPVGFFQQVAPGAPGECSGRAGRRARGAKPLLQSVAPLGGAEGALVDDGDDFIPFEFRDVKGAVLLYYCKTLTTQKMRYQRLCEVKQHAILEFQEIALQVISMTAIRRSKEHQHFYFSDTLRRVVYETVGLEAKE